jgi:hypothetical protein
VKSDLSVSDRAFSYVLGNHADKGAFAKYAPASKPTNLLPSYGITSYPDELSRRVVQMNRSDADQRLEYQKVMA